MYQPLNEDTVVGYIRSLPDVMARCFQPEDKLTGFDLADGNVNLVFRVYSEAAPQSRSVIVKQALPYARIVGESFPMPLQRARIEAEVLELHGRLCPKYVPRLMHFDPEMHLTVMEDLQDYVIMRRGLVQQTVYPNFASHIGTFLARTLFYTSDLYLAHDAKKQAAAASINPGLCKVTEDLVFTDPYTDNPGNVWNPAIDEEAAAIRADDDLRGELYWLKEIFMTKGEALIHGDLHTGSIMVNPTETRVIDPEFAFYGPMAFDSGLVMANLALSYCSQSYHAPDEESRARYRRWLIATMRDVWTIFEREFRQLWATELNAQWATDRFREQYITRLLRETAGFGAAEVMRRILGLAHVADLERIPDLAARAAAERRALAIGRAWLLGYSRYETVEDIVSVVESVQ